MAVSHQNVFSTPCLQRKVNCKVNFLIIHNAQDMEITEVSLNRGLDKEDLVIYTMEYYSAIRKDEIQDGPR